jgi:hypothetical protein
MKKYRKKKLITTTTNYNNNKIKLKQVLYNNIIS